MFTGLIEATGRVAALDLGDRGGRLRLETSLGTVLEPGDSLAVSGVCLTVTDRDAGGASFDLAPATLDVTTLGQARAGQLVNLERALRADDRLGGHFVLGHVDGTGRIASFVEDGDCWWLEVEVPEALEPLVILKGSIAVDGISLTAARLAPGRVSIQIVPFTREHTALAEARAGDFVNLEVDVLGKYVARLLATSSGPGLPAPGDLP
jgi:riboflavin synthase